MQTDFLVIGSGVAGLSFARKVAELGSVILVTKSDAWDSNTNRAQGGIASVMSAADDFQLHVEDTIKAGSGLCDRSRVEKMVSEGPRCIEELIDWGVPFTRSGDELALGREGGHSERRIVHVADYTGRAIEETLIAAVRQHPRIRVLENHLAVNLATGRHLTEEGSEDRVYGAYVLGREKGEVLAISARWTVLATGGGGKVYSYTSNPDVATADGVAMAYRAGARVANMEFVQFHPTCLYHRELRTQLISEAVRGEGGTLLNLAGEAFMEKHDQRRELAPRDIVARAIDYEMKQRGDAHVLLDFSPIGADRIARRFPAITEALLGVGIDPREEPVPVVPAAHYFCGGVDVDLAGRSSLEGLIALGEVSHTGVHGANRLASNSLLEAVAWAHWAAEDLTRSGLDTQAPAELKPWSAHGLRDHHEAIVLEHDWDLVRRIMMDYVGIVRSDERLHLAQARLRHIRETVEQFYWRYRICSELIELRNIALVAELIVRSALLRRESRGLHFNIDTPEKSEEQSEPTYLEWSMSCG